MGRPFLVDFFCCEGGAAMGYYRAGFDIVGVDVNPQRRYPFDFIQASYADVAEDLLSKADAVHASPPCQFVSELTPKASVGRHVNHIPEIRELLVASGKPYVIENVRKAARTGHLKSPVSLFGTMFGNHMVTSVGRKYVLDRERCFETNWELSAPENPGPSGHPIANVFGGHLRCRDAEHRTGKGTGRTVDFPGEDRPALARMLMGMPWASMKGMSEAVPPSMTYYIGRQLIERMGFNADPR
jgi:DNA (cytosine-5)-methyltransferase 1